MTSHFSHLMLGIIPPTSAVKGGFKRDFCHTAAEISNLSKDPISVSLNRVVFQVLEHIEGFFCEDPLIQRDAVVGWQNPADSLVCLLFVTADMGANGFRIDFGQG